MNTYVALEIRKKIMKTGKKKKERLHGRSTDSVEKGCITCSIVALYSVHHILLPYPFSEV